MHLGIVFVALLLASSINGNADDDLDQLHVGLQPDGRIVVPTNQVLKPAGKQVTFPGRPVDLALAEDGRTLVAKNMKSLEFIDTATGTLKQTLVMPKTKISKSGFSVVGLLVDGKRIYVSDTLDQLRVAELGDDGKYGWAEPIELSRPKDNKGTHPAGIAGGPEGKLWVTSTRCNNVQIVNPATGRVEQIIPVGVAPFMICCPMPNRMCGCRHWVSSPSAQSIMPMPAVTRWRYG